MTPSIKPTSKTWTVRFKHHRTTVLLHVDPLQKLSSVRAELLKAVQQTCPNGKLDGHTIPTNEADILLARPSDINNLSLGWDPLQHDPDLDAALTEADTGKGKGKASVSAAPGKSGKSQVTDSVQGAGLRDGGVVAFKFRSEGDGGAQAVDEGVDVEDEDRLDGETLVGEPVTERWDVVVPSMEEIYGDVEMG
ncbi:hypothetical protein Tdes44962_MAKER02594 [Teratosphaeria destructans]|uniref:Uncharacterized protein n=1 Tax=Teratosphaeria destructans TaxID=418781 RepID=A0A9W7SSZ3_9PEZI|nr:hypothetical protein Tdes44962_MAKER02594 [Teratosphaeria destructans]